MTKVVAKVADKEIKESDVLQFIEEIGPQVAMQFQSAEGIKTIIQEMINQEILLLDAKENKLNEEEEFKVVLDHTVDNLLKNYAFSKILSGETVSDEEVEKYFEDNKAVFAKELVNASHILIDSEEKALEIKKEIEEGKDFAQAAMEYSSCPSKDAGGELGEFPRGAMVPEFEDKAFSMEAGEVSEPVKTQFGYHIIKLNSKSDPANITFESVKEDVRSEALRVKQQEAYLKKLDSLKDKYKSEIFEENI